MARAGIKGYHVLLIGAKKIPADDAEKRNKWNFCTSVTQIHSL